MNKPVIGQFILIQVLLALFVLMYTTLNLGRVIVNLEIDSAVSSWSQVYWDTGASFNNHQFSAAKLVVGRNSIANTVYNDIVRPRRIRLDPLTHPGSFSVAKFSIRYTDCLLYLTQYCQLNLKPEKADEQEQIEKSQNSNKNYRAYSNDPKFIWVIPQYIQERTTAYLINLLMCNGFFTLVWLALRLLGFNCEKRSTCGVRGLPAALISVMLLYPAFHGFSWISKLFFNTSGSHSSVFLILLAVFFLVSASSFCNWRNYRIVPRISALVFVLGLLSPDFLFHLGSFSKWPTGSREVPEYHWQLGRSFEDNYRNSALRYLPEIRAISEFLPRQSVFLADSATSYYLTSNLDVFARNPLYHHRISGADENYFIEQEDLEYLCTAGADIQKIKKILASNGINFVVLNLDVNNKNIVSSCLSAASETVIQNLTAFSNTLFEGENLILIDVKGLLASSN